ncbi:hypothetical protein CFC21_064697 [Triticum aestivum]|uniref:Uncharacterized protein n=3 Tax=Triticum TaxID=4564 RepID=A0A9R0WJS7_TRITD|nr:uncharacterized protein LOC119300496 [Triticum dicoccoides]XP_044379974.1 uncharacterized protein LOC123102622 [Triticum aestivum]KAF7057424.1 hypothetical protein CFC21_064697 [Triticum aestivum]VAI14311.1 unnamed protein product [Triticum turgidum subsp. durum]
MASGCAKRKHGGEARCRCRCRHVHVHYHLPRRRVSLLRWLPRPRLSLLSYLLVPPVLSFALLAFVVSFLWFTLLYFVASLLSNDDDLESVKNVGIGGPASDVEDSGQEGNSEAKGEAVRHAAEHLTGDTATADNSFRRLEIKEVRADGFSQVPRTNDDKLVEDVNIFETSSATMADSEGFSGWRQVQDVPVDWFVDEHDIRVDSSSTPDDLFPSLYSTDSAEIHDLPDMDEPRGMSPDFLAESKQNMVVSSNTSCHHHSISDEYGEEYRDDRKELSACGTYEIIDFIDKHETRDQAPDGSFVEDEETGQFESSDEGSTQEKDAKSVLELVVDSIATLEDFREKQEVQNVPEVLITEANAEQSVGASNEGQDSSSEKEASVVSLHSVCEDAASSDASSHHYLVYEDDKQEEVTKHSTAEAEAPDPASAVICNIFENRQTPRNEAFDGFENDDEAREVASQESLGDETDKINDDSASELDLKGVHRGAPLLRRSPSQWWNLCGVVDVFAGSGD